MNISGFIKQAKIKISQAEAKRYNKMELQTLAIQSKRKEVEEKAKIRKNYYDEKDKLSKARNEKKKYTAISQLKKELDERKKNKAKKENAYNMPSNNKYDLGGRNVFE